MTRYLLDTNIVRESSKPQPSAVIAEWVQIQAAADLFISTLTIAEIKRGILELAAGQRRSALERWFIGPEGPHALFHERILTFDEPHGKFQFFA